MPKVRTPSGPTVQAAPLNAQPWSPAVPEGAFDRGAAGLAKAGRGIMDASDKLDKIFQEQTERDNKTLARDTMLKISDAVLPIQQGALKTQGLEVKGKLQDDGSYGPDVYEGTKSQMDATVADLTKNLNPRAKELVDTWWSTRKESHLTQVFAHKEGELVKAAKLAAQAGVAESQQAYWANPTPQTLEQSKREILDMHSPEILRGQDASVVKNQTEKWISQLHQGAVEGMLRAEQKNPKAIREYVKTYKKEIDPETLNKIEDHLRPQEQAYKADELAQGYYAKLRAGADEARITEQIMGIEDIAVRKATLSAFHTYSSVFKQQQAERKMDLTLDGLAKIQTMPLPEAYKYWQGMPEGDKAQREAKKAVGKQYDAIAKFGGIQNVQTDPSAWMAGMEAVQYGEVRTEKELRAYLASKGPVAEQDVKGILGALDKSQKVSDTTIRDAYKWSVGKDGKPDTTLTKSQQAEALAFKTFVQSRVSETNRNDPEYIKKLATLFQTSGETKGGFALGYGEDKKLGKLVNERGEVADPTWMPDMTKDDQNRIQAIFESNKQAADAWLKKAGGDADMARRMYRKAELLEEAGPRRRR